MDWWQRLQVREQFLLLMAAGLLGGSLLYVLLWQPLADELLSQQQRYQVLQKNLSWMHEASQQVAKLRGARSQSSAFNGSLLVGLERLVQRHGIQNSIKEMAPEGEHSVRLLLNPVKFDSVLKLLSELQQHGVKVNQLMLSPEKSPGMVAGRVTLVKS